MPRSKNPKNPKNPQNSRQSSEQQRDPHAARMQPRRSRLSSDDDKTERRRQRIAPALEVVKPAARMQAPEPRPDLEESKDQPIPSARGRNNQPPQTSNGNDECLQDCSPQHGRHSPWCPRNMPQRQQQPHIPVQQLLQARRDNLVQQHLEGQANQPSELSSDVEILGPDDPATQQPANDTRIPPSLRIRNLPPDYEVIIPDIECQLCCEAYDEQERIPYKCPDCEWKLCGVCYNTEWLIRMERFERWGQRKQFRDKFFKCCVCGVVKAPRIYCRQRRRQDGDAQPEVAPANVEDHAKPGMSFGSVEGQHPAMEEPVPEQRLRPRDAKILRKRMAMGQERRREQEPEQRVSSSNPQAIVLEQLQARVNAAIQSQECLEELIDHTNHALQHFTELRQIISGRAEKRNFPHTMQMQGVYEELHSFLGGDLSAGSFRQSTIASLEWVFGQLKHYCSFYGMSVNPRNAKKALQNAPALGQDQHRVVTQVYSWLLRFKQWLMARAPQQPNE